MDCLLDYIGLQGCSQTVPDSGLFVNDLAGIQLRQVDEIADEDQQNFTGVFAKVQARSLKIFEKDVKHAFRQKHALKGLTQSINIGKLVDTSITKAASSEYRGLAIELNEANDDVVCSNLQLIFIQTINIFVPGAETFNVKIFDLDSEEELFTKSVTTTTSGFTSINVNDSFLSSRRISVVYDCSSINSVKLDIADHELNCFQRCKSRVRGVISTVADPANVTFDTNNTQGLSVIFSIQCKYDVVVCNNKDIFAQALLYLLGSQLMFEQMNSSRTTRWTMLENKQAKFLHGYYKAMYMGGVFNEETFHGELERSVEMITLDQFDCCVECSGPLMFQDAYL